MESKYRGRIIFTFVIGLFLCVIAEAQTEKPDTTVTKQEEIITIGYGQQPAWMVSGAVSTVKGDDLRKSFTTTLGHTLFGRLPGLTVTQAGAEPGLESPTLRIRGTSTYNSGKSILVLVDGIESYLDKMIPDEIESVTILKDAGSTAMYGSKGANGVLLVTTKRGFEGPLKVGFSMQFGASSPSRLPKFLGSYDYATLYNEGLANDGKPALYTQGDLDAYQDGSDPTFHPDVNWYNQLLRKTVPISNYDLNFTGGNRIVRYFVILNYMTNQGLYKKTGDLSEDYSINSTYKRVNLRSNVDIDLTKKLLLNFTLGGSVEDKTNPAALNTSTIFSNLSRIPSNSFPVYNPGGSYSASLIYSNPWGDLLEKGLYTSNGRVFYLRWKLTQKLDFITPGLTVSGLISFDNNFNSLSTKSRTYRSFSISKDASGNIIYTPIGQNTSLTGSESESNQYRNFALQGFLNYNRTFGKTSLDGVLMANSSNNTVTGGIGVPNKDNGLYGRFNVTNSEKYIAEFSFAFNGSDGFPEGSRYGFFPAGSVGWVVSNEDFLKGNNIFNFLKLRASYGLTGNDNIAAARRYMWVTDFVSINSYYFGTSNTTLAAIAEGMAADSSITWEKQKQFNIGLDLTLLNHFDITLDIFKQNRYDILAAPYLSIPQFVGSNDISGLGTSFPQYNVGMVDNKGFEFTVRYNSDRTKHFQYYVQAGVWYAKNKIVYNAEAIQIWPYLYSTGQSIGQPFVLQAEGFFKDAADIANSARQLYADRVVPGDIKYKDQNNDGIIDQSDNYPIGNPELPTMTGSLEAGFSYKGLEFSVFFQGVSGNTRMQTGDYFYAFQNNGNAPEAALGRWTTATAATATYPRLSGGNNLNNFRSSSFWQENGSFIKLRSLELGYNLPDKIVSKIRLASAKVFLNGTNLFSLDHMNGFTDPEIMTGYPSMRSYTIGIRVQL